ncbi:GntP family permease [Streptomyces sp. SLBN-118]|nr:GntP family permease [Streptomyces sp. SLBN-118]
MSTSSLKPVGNILLVVGAGGIFGAVLKASGVAQALSDAFNGIGLPVIVLASLIALVLRVALGSATVAIVTTAGIVLPLVENGDHSQAFLALVIMAISAGSIFASHVNDGGFWIVAKYFGISERDTLKSWTVVEPVLSVSGFAVAAALSLALQWARTRKGAPGSPGRPLPYQLVQYCCSLPIERYMQSEFSRSWSTASRLRLVSRSITSSGG